MVVEIPHRKWQLWGLSSPLKKHSESVLWHFMQQKINKGDSGNAGLWVAGCNALDWSASHYIVPL